MSANRVNTKPIYLGLTGGIASGKSTASQHFSSTGIPVIDCDHIVAHLWINHQLMRQNVQETFGFDIKTQEDKHKLASIIFDDTNMRNKLNQIIHPYVFEEIEKQKAHLLDKPLVVIDMPLLFEVGYQEHVDYTVLIDVPQATQIKRLRNRNQMPYSRILARIRAQMPLSKKRKMADFVIRNTGTIKQLNEQIDTIIQKVLYEK